MNVPSQQDIQSRLAYVSCVDKLDGMYFHGKKFVDLKMCLFTLIFDHFSCLLTLFVYL